MTTIAWDGKTLAADRMCTVGNLKRTRCKLADCGEYVYGHCGDVQDTTRIADWIREGMPADKRITLDEEGCWGLAVHKRTARVFRVVGKIVCLIPTLDPQEAAGSGQDFALSAMAYGKTAEQAVDFASEFDVYTGRGIDTLDFPR